MWCVFDMGSYISTIPHQIEKELKSAISELAENLHECLFPYQEKKFQISGLLSAFWINRRVKFSKISKRLFYDSKFSDKYSTHCRTHGTIG